VQWVCANHWAPVFEETVSSCHHIWLILTELLWELTEDKIHTQCRMTLHGPHSILLHWCPRRGEWLLTCRLLPPRPPDSNLGNHYLWGGSKQLHLGVLDKPVHTYCWNMFGTSGMESQIVLRVFKNWQHWTNSLGLQEAWGSIQFKW